MCYCFQLHTKSDLIVLYISLLQTCEVLSPVEVASPGNCNALSAPLVHQSFAREVVDHWGHEQQRLTCLRHVIATEQLEWHILASEVHIAREY